MPGGGCRPSPAIRRVRCMRASSALSIMAPSPDTVVEQQRTDNRPGHQEKAPEQRVARRLLSEELDPHGNPEDRRGPEHCYGNGREWTADSIRVIDLHGDDQHQRDTAPSRNRAEVRNTTANCNLRRREILRCSMWECQFSTRGDRPFLADSTHRRPAAHDPQRSLAVPGWNPSLDLSQHVKNRLTYNGKKARQSKDRDPIRCVASVRVELLVGKEI